MYAGTYVISQKRSRCECGEALRAGCSAARADELVAAAEAA